MLPIGITKETVRKPLPLGKESVLYRRYWFFLYSSGSCGQEKPSNFDSKGFFLAFGYKYMSWYFKTLVQALLRRGRGDKFLVEDREEDKGNWP